MRRTIGYLVVYNAGMVTFGLATMDTLGVTGALFEAWNQMIIVLLLFVSIGLLERPDGRPANVVRRDLLWRWPVASALGSTHRHFSQLSMRLFRSSHLFRLCSII